METETPGTVVRKWYFDNYSRQHWEEIRAGEIKETLSWVQLSDTDEGQVVEVFVNRQKMPVGNVDHF
jgi:hypothetical protein